MVHEQRYEHLEITTRIGCPNNCLKYCPQEVITSMYSGKRTLALDDWKVMLDHVPKELPLLFSGFCEPFANNRTIDLIDMASEVGHPIGIYTSLYQASREDVEKLIKYSFLVFCLHLPDGKVMKIPISQEYKDNVFTVLQNVGNVHFSIMNDFFESNNRENISRGSGSRKKPFRLCIKLKNPQFNLLPNGDVILCCMDYGLRHILGNLLTENYVDIRKRFLEHKKTFSLCSTCYYNASLMKTLAELAQYQVKKNLLHLPV